MRRRKDVTRDEVRTDHWFCIITGPRSAFDNHRNPIERLWQPLVRLLQQEQKRKWDSPEQQALNARLEAGGLDYPPPEATDIMPSGFHYRGYCRRCFRSFFHPLKHPSRYCSDKCAGAAKAATVFRYVKRRSEKRKAARARKCAVCSTPLNAQRASKRFCSVRCRIAEHRAER